jgi:hypothetical protein
MRCQEREGKGGGYGHALHPGEITTNGNLMCMMICTSETREEFLDRKVSIHDRQLLDIVGSVLELDVCVRQC